MGRTVAIAGRFVGHVPGLIATPYAATIGTTLLLHGVFDVVRATGGSAGTTVQRLDGAPAGRSCCSESDTAGAQRLTPATPNAEPAVVDAERVEGERNPVTRLGRRSRQSMLTMRSNAAMVSMRM
jgi:hypothetical protein